MSELDLNPLLAGRRVTSAPGSVYYVADFISAAYADELTAEIQGVPRPKWEVLAARRLQNWGGIIGRKGSLIRDDIPPWLEECMGKVAPLFPAERQPNHCLVNEYLPGQGIMMVMYGLWQPHTDGPAFHPLITTLTLGSHAMLDIYRPLEDGASTSLSERWVGCLLLEPRSLVVITDDVYSRCLHGINPVKEDVLRVPPWNLAQCGSAPTIGETLSRGTRISLTIRNVPRVAKNSIGTLLGK